MKIITRAVMQWDESIGNYATIEEESYDYDGPIALCHKPKTPPAPDPRVVASAQTDQNRDTAGYNAALNRINTYGPMGSQEYTNTGIDPTTGAPMYRQDIKLDPMLEQIYRSQLGQDRGLAGAQDSRVAQINGMQPFSTDGLPALSTDFDALRKSSSDALYGRNTAYLDPQFKQGEDALRSRMANQGIVEGSEAANNATGDFNRSKEFAYGQARDSAIAGGGAEAERQFGMESAARGQMMSEMLTQRGVPMQELGFLRGMTNVDMPQYEGTPQVGTNPADIMGATNNQYQGQLDTYNANTASKNAMMAGLLSTAGTAAMVF